VSAGTKWRDQGQALTNWRAGDVLCQQARTTIDITSTLTQIYISKKSGSNIALHSLYSVCSLVADPPVYSSVSDL
jgi:hypothetical protein